MLRARRVDVGAAVAGVADGLRSGLSLRQSILRSAGATGSPLAPLAAALAGGQPLVDVLREACVRSGDADLRSALCVLAAHAEAGGDPIPAVGALADRLRRLQAAQREARALTTQARLGGRAILLLTPGFWLLLGAADTRGFLSSMSEPSVRALMVAGIALQLLGAIWIGSIVRRSVGARESRLAHVPVLRAVSAIVGGKRRSSTPMDVAVAAETLVFVLESGIGPGPALERVAPLASGEFGVRLRLATARIRAGGRVTESLTRACAGLDASANAFADAFDASISLGVPLAPSLRALADTVRECATTELAEDVRRASVRVLVPLGLLILPAFVLSCLVPLLAGGLGGIAGP